ncbi:hypothetical protein CEXT_284731 [Caerostris extrusa]|uniref:Uncharacterized protein n=1 Tax=Caerostris extrusa TaxID=172846 RepID=A0AAV4Q9M7_CAEEX|nr:hypothetical protein CEXT_284731 [Caerostris extrusa]
MRVDHSRSQYTLLVHEASLEDEAEFQCQVPPLCSLLEGMQILIVPPFSKSLTDVLNKLPSSNEMGCFFDLKGKLDLLIRPPARKIPLSKKGLEESILLLGDKVFPACKLFSLSGKCLS